MIVLNAKFNIPGCYVFELNVSVPVSNVEDICQINKA